MQFCFLGSENQGPADGCAQASCPHILHLRSENSCWPGRRSRWKVISSVKKTNWTFLSACTSAFNSVIECFSNRPCCNFLRLKFRYHRPRQHLATFVWDLLLSDTDNPGKVRHSHLNTVCHPYFVCDEYGMHFQALSQLLNLLSNIMAFTDPPSLAVW